MPSFGVALFTTFVTARSARGTVTATESRSLTATGSSSSTPETNAVFRSVVPLVPALTVATSVSVALSPFATLPTVHTPVPDTYDP